MYNPDTIIDATPDLAAGVSSPVPHPHQLDPPASTPATTRSDADDAVDALHSLCGVYTRPTLVQRLLDRVDWTPTADLSGARLLEPGAGDGAFLAEAVRRLVRSFIRRDLRLNMDSLRDRVLAYELVPREASKARARVVSEMTTLGVQLATARACADAWVKTEDFLLAALPDTGFTHIVGNPPYIRWSKLPDTISAAYTRRLPKTVARGDLYLPFLHRSFEHLAPDGRCAFVCSDRWRYTVYAEGFRKRWCMSLRINTESAGDPKDAFDRDVYVHPEILTATPYAATKPTVPKHRSRGRTLADLGCTIRVGPALGVTPAFVLNPDEEDVEDDLLHPWVDTREVLEGRVDWSGRRVISPFDDSGTLIDLNAYPRLASRLRRFEERLRARYIVRNGAPWHRTIDKLVPAVWSAPKLLIPEVAKSPRVAIDLTGAIPSHGIYAIFANNADIEEIYGHLRDGRLARAIAPIAPKVKGRYTRCYRRFLAMMEL
ncbi:MAG: hypothetical protein OXH99_05770 [Bryobacterales bacterium]|nr:hypothetical protein [Bryobacterales bacterium]